MAEVSAKTLPPGFGYEWTGTAFQEQRAGGQTGIVLGMALLFAYLFLVGLYESWIIPVPVLLSVVTARARSLCGRPGIRVDPRSLRPDRPRRADRDGGQERHPHRRVRQGPARERAWASWKRPSSAQSCGSAP